MLQKLTEGSAGVAGKKATSLARLIQAGFNVPSGFVILTTGLKFFLEKNLSTKPTTDLAPDKVREAISNNEVAQELVAEIRTAIKQINANTYAVRSSGPNEDGNKATWAGQFESYLSVKEADIVTAIKNCWLSLLSPRADAYRNSEKVKVNNTEIAVIVQTMVESEISGVAFSVNPITKNKNEVVIEMVNGLGDVLVHGSLTPETYIVRKENQEVSIGSDPLVSKEATQITQTLTPLLIQLEALYKSPIDIEWTYAQNKLFLLQCRNITTL